MAFSTSGSSGVSSEINVTPLIDVLLVLLIIFMVTVPVMPHGLPSLLPQPPKEQAHVTPDGPIVLEVLSSAGGGVHYALNQKSFGKEALGQELGRVMAGRSDKVMFVRGDRDLQFSQVAEVIGLGHQVNADRIGIITPQSEAGR